MLQRLKESQILDCGSRIKKRRGRRWLSPFAIRYSLFAISAPLVVLAAGGLPEWVHSGWSYLLLALGFSLVIFVHELGHFAAAKWANVRVERFAIGFGKELFGFTKGETRYSFNVLPLGGYVKMLGQEDFVVDKTGELKVKNDPNSFTNKSVAQRMVIISDGVIMNLFFAAVAFAIVVMVGRPQPPPVVGQVVETSAAARAGLQTGDRIIAINGAKVETFPDLSARITLSDADEELVLDILRDGKPVEPPPRVKPEYKKNASVRQIGVGPGMNLRVADTTLRPGDAPRPDELKKYDEFDKLVVKGEAKEFKDLGVFRRAVAQAQGAPVEIIVKRPKNPEALSEEAMYKNDPDVDSTETKVQVRAIWLPVPYEMEDEVSGSLLGLVPRMTVLYAEPGKSFEKAGVEPGDIITKINGDYYPSHSVLKRAIEENAGREVAIEVRRPAQANGDLSAEFVRFCVKHREELIEAARSDVQKALELGRRLAKSENLSPSDEEKLSSRLKPLGDGPAWRRWLERVDVHTLKPIVPKAPFALFGKTEPPIDANLRCFDEDHVVVADVKPSIGDRVSPAQAAGIPVGAVILACDGRKVGRWQELSEIFRPKIGKTVEISYRVADEVRTARMAIPDCISSSLAMPFGSRIIRVAGKESCVIKNMDK
jgi:membrane-associated protease RseP (regulator of RpoE activity)